MDDAVARLMVILDAEEDLYNRLRDVLQREREVIVKMDADALERIARTKEELCDEARLLEESRAQVASELAGTVGLPERGSRLSEICRRLGPAAGRLRTQHNRLVILVSVVRELLDANAGLAGESLSEVRSTLRLLGGLLPEENLYQASGPPAPLLQTGRLIRRSA